MNMKHDLVKFSFVLLFFIPLTSFGLIQENAYIGNGQTVDGIVIIDINPRPMISFTLDELEIHQLPHEETVQCTVDTCYTNRDAKPPTVWLVPDWVYNIHIWYDSEQITELEYMYAQRYLVDNVGIRTN